MSNQIQEDIVKFYTIENLSYSKISERLRVSIATVRSCLKKHGIKGKPFKFYKRGTKFDVRKVCQAYLGGKNGHQIEKELGMTSGTSYGCLKRGGVITRPASEFNRKYSADFNYFHAIDTQNKAQVLGFISADGCITESKNGQRALKITLHNQDLKYLEWIKQELKYTGPIRSRFQKKTKTTYVSLDITSSQMFEDLTRLGVTVRKTLTLNPPPEHALSDDLFPSYVRGLFEGDGCIFLGGKYGTEAQISIAGTRSVLTIIRDYVIHELLITCSVSKIKGKRCYIFVVNGNRQILKFLNLIYDKSQFQMKRKYEKYLFLKNLFNSEGTKRVITFFKNRKIIHIKSPTGQIWHVKNVSAFARDNGLQPAHVGNLLAGRLKHHGKWTTPTPREIEEATASGSLITKFYPDL